jgi:ankyrin repeat protein
MPPLNPFLRAFFKSAFPSQCQPASHHVLLCPTTEILLSSKDRESGVSFAELAGSEEFLASHVIRVPGGGQPQVGKDGQNIREPKGKAKQYSTVNGRTVVMKDSFVYSNKGFKTLNQAQLLSDALHYADTNDGQQWLVYYISRPLIGAFQSTPIIPAVISDEPSKERRKLLAEVSGGAGPSSNTGGGAVFPKKKVIKNFGDLLMQYPMISRQMHGGLEKIIREFVTSNDEPVQQRSSRRSSMSSQRSAPSINGSVRSLRSSLSGSTMIHPTALELEPEEETMRGSLETAVTSAIDLFQGVDKTQLSLLGTNTELTGPVVEHMIERYITEQVHDQTLFPKVCAIRRPDDADLERKIRRMTDVDIAQVGIPIEDGMQGKRDLALRLNKGVDVFKRMGVASSPQEMLDILLSTQKAITEPDSAPKSAMEIGQTEDALPSNLTINADVLVSMLLIVVIRSTVRHLHARLLYMRYFIFIDEVESGEQGYALATLEAVLAHLSGESRMLRKASKKNRALWQAAKIGDVSALQNILQPDLPHIEDDALVQSPLAGEESTDDQDTSLDMESFDEPDAPNAHENAQGDFAAVGGSLQHVFPFQKPPTPPPESADGPKQKKKKRVSLAPRSMSQSSVISSRSHSRTKSIDSMASSGVVNDMSVEKLAQTQDTDGNSVIMMAVDAGQKSSLHFLLSLPAHFRADHILNDMNDDGVTLLSAAVQSGNVPVTEELLQYLEENASDDQLRQYLAIQDSKGRCVGHYVFNQPHLIQRFGRKLPWRLKDKNGQTPLFALSRSYDHDQYHSMIETALSLATETQGDGQPLHHDDHVDAKGNTLLHIINDTDITMRLLRSSDVDVNAANDKRFTPLMVGSKYGRLDLVRVLFGDPRTDTTLRDLRGLSAVELAKDDDVRNRFDDLVLLSVANGSDERTTKIVRSFFVEDGTVRLVLKSGAKNPNGTITVNTCRRTPEDFANLSKWLHIECPASWLPTQFNLASPFLIPGKPSRALLRDTQIRLDNFFRTLLTHATFATHELVWEFFLVPEIDGDMLLERSKRKAEARVDNLKDDFEPITDTLEVSNFVAYAREQVKGVTGTTRRAIRTVNQHRMRQLDFFESAHLASNAVSTLVFLPQSHLNAFDRYTRSLALSEANPMTNFYYTLHSIHSTSTAIQNALDRPATLIGSMEQSQRIISRTHNSLSRANRWTPGFGLFEDTKKAAAQDAWNKAAKAKRELESLGCELRYTQQTVASELAGWQEEHVKVGKEMLRKLARETIVKEKAKLGGMMRALREIRKVKGGE